MYDTLTPGVNVSDKMQKLLNEKKSAREIQIHKHADWNENYELYRNKVRTNRLTQRQAVNVPLMKETVKTLLSGADEAPFVNWTELSGDGMKEIIYQEIWETFIRDNNVELLDILDKKNVFLNGISTKMLNLKEDGIAISVLDPFDVAYDPMMDSLDIETARFIVRQNIFKPLREILVDKRYTQKGKDALKDWLASEKGLIQSGKNKEEWEKKMERLRAMGVYNDKFPYFAGGDVMVNCTEHFTNVWNAKTKKFERRVVVYADDVIELMDDSLVDCIGVDFWPFDFWTEDPETNDIYPDSIADMVRVPNKIVNVWYSQYTENRSLSNMGMNWYDSTKQGYVPQTYEPGQGRMLPAPGNPYETIMPVKFESLRDTLEGINFLTAIIERSTGATSIEKGVAEKDVKTLGEVQVLVGKATERAKTMAKFYRASWYRIAKKWDGMMQANNFPKMTLYKTGADGKIYEKVVYNKDWKSKAGYRPDVASSSEQEADEIKSIQKFGFVIQQFPENQVLKTILQGRELKMLDLTPAELALIEEEQERMQEAAVAPAENPNEQAMQPMAQPQPVQAAMPAMPQAQQPAPEEGDDISSMLKELTALA